MKSKTNISVVSNTGVRRKSEVIIGDSGTYTSGDILDANATQELINSGGGAGGDSMSIVIVDSEPEDNKFNLEAGKLYKCNFNLNGIDFILPEPSSTEFVQHIIILGRLDGPFGNVTFDSEVAVEIQSNESIPRGTVPGYYRIDCTFVGYGWQITAVNVMPDQL